LTGDPFSDDTWHLDLDGMGQVVRPVHPTLTYGKNDAMDVTAPQVSVSIDGHEHSDPVTVILTATDEEGGSGVAYILYAFGNDPTPRRYTGSFVVNRRFVTTLTAVSVDRAGNQSLPMETLIGAYSVFLPLLAR
jgi:hypothetical protein